MDINFDDPKIASMPKILLMGPRRGGKTSIQVRRALVIVPEREHLVLD
jgi:predicted AAA+ superfamily ATPase